MCIKLDSQNTIPGEFIHFQCGREFIILYTIYEVDFQSLQHDNIHNSYEHMHVKTTGLKTEGEKERERAPTNKKTIQHQFYR